MSLVTPQGIAAQQELESTIEAALVAVLEVVEARPLLPNELLNTLGSEWGEDVVREAMWQLLEKHDLELLSDRRLSLVS